MRRTQKRKKHDKEPYTRTRCQCDPRCPNPPLRGQPFCAHHMHRCNRISPLTGSEPEYNPDKYNKSYTIQDSHNCFAYAFDHYDPPMCDKSQCPPTPFHQPGRKSGFPKWSDIKGKRCPDLIARLRADIPGIKLATFRERCPKGTSKISLVVDPKNDYHFFRQDADGKWSHKPGATKVTRLDSTGRWIYDPALANRDYRHTGSNLNYKYHCSYLCAPKNRTLKFKRGGSKKQTRRKPL